MKDILRAAIAVPTLSLADVTANTTQLEGIIREANEQGVTLLTFPELSLTGYSLGDLFTSELLLSRTEEALCLLAAGVPEGMLVAVGAPLLIKGMLFDCAVLLSGGKIVGAVPKTAVTAEGRQFSSADALNGTVLHTIDCFTFPVGADLLIRGTDKTTVGVVLGEDCSSPLPAATLLALSGAEVILCLSAKGEIVTARETRRTAITALSEHSKSAILYAGAGMGESVSDEIFAGHGIIALCGSVLKENDKPVDDGYLLVADLDLGRLRHDRLSPEHRDAAARYGSDGAETVDLSFPLAAADGALLAVRRLPFVPDEKETRDARCLTVFELQTAALARRLTVVGGKLTIGISGGLDSTLALLVAANAMDRLGLPRTNITAVTMPCFGTSDDTLQNALALMEALGVTSMTIPIGDAVLQHFKDIGHDKDDYSVTYENSQARERTQVLMDLTNKRGGIVLGTGDLSEMALGWCTYNGDHMSMYAVNANVPKTLIRWIIEAVLDRGLFAGANDVLHRIIDTPISPELLPPDAVGKIAQKTEDIVGPYALHDFFLYYTVRYGYRPSKIFLLATRAFDGIFDPATVKKWLTVFTRRFFNQQFKRNCVPDGVKIGSVSLSPRGDWNMPSDAVAADWLREIEDIEV